MIVVFFYQIEPALGDEKQEIALQQPIILSLPNAPTREEVANYIGFKALEMKLDPAMVLRIAKCESGLNYLSKNKNSTASGIFQFLNSTWSSTRKQMGVEKSSQFNAQDNIDTAIWKIKNGGIGAWNESKKCWK